jgi:hypothetical protein
MSTIKSSAENLTLNADGSGNDIKFQSNGVEKASISDAGLFTSTTIDATKLTGNLPAISGAALTGVGVDGITSSADATAINIDSSENVNIVNGGKYLRFAYNNSNSHSAFQGWKHLQFGNNGANYIIGGNTATGGSLKFVVNNTVEMSSDNANSHDGTVSLELRADGRATSQFTANAWVNFNGEGTVAIRDSHNCSSIYDEGSGDYYMNFSNNMANTDYAAFTSHYEGDRSSVVHTRAVGSVRVQHWQYAASGKYDAGHFYVLVFGD